MVAIHRSSYGSHKPTPEDKADAMAITMGPSLAESKIQNANGDSFPEEIDYSQDFSKIFDMASYYRQGAASARWHKSLETIAGLHGIAGDEGLRRTSSGTGIFDEGIPGVLKAPSTIIWGQKDIALDPHICLDGIGDYLVKDSQVVMLPRSGHWTPIEMESRAALEAAIQWAVGGEKGEVEAAVQASYPDAAITVRR
jgi:pimeloyl-ACP methyl ester carboxylesterase